MAVTTTIGQRSSTLLRPLLAALAFLALLASPVLAEDILRLEGPVTDTTGVLADGRDEIESAIQTTLDERGVQVFVLFVRTTGDLTADDYVRETASRNSLGTDDALLLVALDDRTDQIWLADGLDQITDEELDGIVAGTLEPGLRGGDFPAAVIATVEALGEAAVSAPATAAPETPVPATSAPGGGSGSTGGGGSTDGSDGIDFGSILALAVIAGGAFLVWQGWSRRSGRVGTPGPGSGTPPPDPVALGRQANALLIATDERIRDAGQETDFAEAQYGAEAVVSFRTAVAEARDELAKAFVVRQRLDDDTPEDEPTRIAMLQEIVARTTKAQERLDAETGRIRELHDLERDAPNRIVELPARIEAVEDRIDAADATMRDLQQYHESVWGPVRGNLEEARKGLAGARTAVTQGSQAIASDDRSAVAVATRTAMEGMTGASGLLDEIDQLAASVREAVDRIPTELSEADHDLADATAALAGRSLDPAVDARRRAAVSALDNARSAAASPGDPVAALRSATEAHRLADETLLAARDAVAAADRVVAAANSTIQTASAEVGRAATFIASRRRGVGEVARTRLAEAQRHLGEASAILPTDAARALNEGRRAQELAHEAYRLAQDDFSDWDQGGHGWGQRRGTSGGDQTAQLLGSILGGVIGGVIAGGGRGGGWGGSPWGGGGGGGRTGGGGWGGGGGFGSGGFGGGGGGGGGRTGGGHW